MSLVHFISRDGPAPCPPPSQSIHTRQSEHLVTRRLAAERTSLLQPWSGCSPSWRSNGAFLCPTLGAGAPTHQQEIWPLDQAGVPRLGLPPAKPLCQEPLQDSCWGHSMLAMNHVAPLPSGPPRPPNGSRVGRDTLAPALWDFPLTCAVISCLA